MGADAGVLMEGGECGALLRRMDWAAHPLGLPVQWPPALRTLMSVMLAANQPMFVAWGQEQTLLYNDGYAQFLHARHPAALGRPFFEAWHDIRADVEPIMSRAYAGVATTMDDILLVMHRKGYPEETHFSFFYAPVRDESGRVGGVFCACTETTGKVLAERKRAEENERQRRLFDAAPGFIAILRGPRHEFEFVNEAYRRLAGGRELLGRPVRAAFPEIAEQGLLDLLDTVYRTGERFVAHDMPIVLASQAGESQALRLDFVYEPMLDEADRVVGIFVQGSDVTATYEARQALQESERRFRDLSDSAPVMVWVTRPDGHCEYLNKRWLEFTGQTPEQAEGFGWLAAVHPQDAPAAHHEFLAANAGRRPVRLEYRLRRHDGQYRWCIDSAVPRVDARGDSRGYIGSVIDITERKHSEAALAAEKHALELIATGSPLATVLQAVAFGAEAQSADDMRCSILVLDEAGEVLRLGAAPSLPPAYNAAIDGLHIGPAVGTCGTAAYERRMVVSPDLLTDPCWEPFRHLAVQHRLGACVSLPILDAAGRLQGTFAMYYARAKHPSEHDLELARSATHLAGIVLEKHRLDEQLQRALLAEQSARSQAEFASRMKDEFLATLSHELRTPLNSILGWVALLRHQGGRTERLAQGLEVIDRNARAQATIIADLLDMSGIISGKVRLERQAIDLHAVVALAVETVRPTAQAKQIDLALLAEAPGPIDMAGDPDRLQQVLWNLLSNAIKFTPAGGCIEVRLARSARGVELEVGDNGEGIAADFLPFVFDRFRQADASTTRRHGGLGLGLSIVKKLVELHGGTIDVRSAGPGHGTTFWVRLPLAPANGVTQQLGDAAARTPTGSTAQPAQGETGMSGLRVLLVDDDADGLVVTRHVLESAQAVVTIAASAQAAMTLLRGQRFDVLVSDLGMPEIDGYALIQWVRSREAAQGGGIAAVALSAYARTEDKARAIEAGFQRHVAKPVEPAHLLATVASVAAWRPEAPAGP